MRIALISLTAIVILGGVGGLEGAARADKKCGACDTSVPEVLLPRNGATGVPTNTRILVNAEKLGEGRWAAMDTTLPPPDLSLALFDKKGNLGSHQKVTVSTMLSEAWGTVYVLTAKKPLAANTTYALVRTVTEGRKKNQTQVSTFTTGAAADTQPPVFAGVERFTAIIGLQVRTKCHVGDPPYNQLSWDFGAATDDTSSPEDLVRILYVQKQGEQKTIRMIEPASRAPITAVNGTTCDPFKPSFKVGDEVCASIEILDLAGNAAGAAVEKCMTAKRM